MDGIVKNCQLSQMVLQALKDCCEEDDVDKILQYYEESFKEEYSKLALDLENVDLSGTYITVKEYPGRDSIQLYDILLSHCLVKKKETETNYRGVRLLLSREDKVLGKKKKPAFRKGKHTTNRIRIERPT